MPVPVPPWGVSWKTGKVNGRGWCYLFVKNLLGRKKR